MFTVPSARPRVNVGHICLEVSDLDKAKGFYVPLLERLGFKVILSDKDTIGVSNGAFALWLTGVESKRVERKSPTGEEFVVADHFALLVENRKAVNDVAKFMDSSGFKPLFPPEDHPEFREGYFSTSFCDNDNNVIEFYVIEKSEA
jgi:catechol 2,3-dioxygenase-like lactoylglutathione lyase family enzyme